VHYPTYIIFFNILCNLTGGVSLGFVFRFLGFPQGFEYGSNQAFVEKAVTRAPRLPCLPRYVGNAVYADAWLCA